MSPRTKKQYEEIREERRQQIMQAALELFANKGFDATSISMIAKEAGISKGLMYNYFESKENLIAEIMDQIIDQMMIMFDPNRDGTIELHEMEGFIHLMCAHMRENLQAYRLYFHIALQPKVFKLIENKIDEMIVRISKLTINYFRDMGFENPEVEAMFFGTLLDGLFFDYIMKPDLFPIDLMEEELIKRYCTKKSKP